LSTNLFSPADREVIAAHIGEMELTDAVLQRFFDSAIEQAIDKHETALDAYRRALTMERAEDEPEPVPPVVPTPEDAVSAMMVNLRAALDVHTGDDGRARAFEDEMAKAIVEAELINAAVDILDARYRKAAPAPDPHNFPANLSDKLSDWDTTADENEARLSPEEAEAEVARLVSNQAEGFDLADEISGLSQTRRDDLTQALHKRKGRMRRERMTGATPQVEEAALDHLVDLLARRGV